MKNILLLLLTILGLTSGIAQEKFIDKEGKVGLSAADLQKAVDDYLTMTQTATYKANKIAMMNLDKKINTSPIPKELMNEDAWSNWVTANLTKTKFTTVDEAMQLRKLYVESYQKLMTENPGLYQMIKKATLAQLHEILKPERAGRPF